MTSSSDRGDHLDPEVLRVLEDWEQQGHPETQDSEPAEARLVLREFASRYSVADPDVRVEEVSVPGEAGLRARVYRAPQPREDGVVVLYLHGGGWVLGDLDTHDHICRALAASSGAVVVSPDYRLAPESPFPVGLYDAYDVLVWLADGGAGAPEAAPPVRLVLAGDSAGANLAAATAILAQRRGGPSVSEQILFYPVTEREFESESFASFGEGYFLSTAAMRWFWEQYQADDRHGELAGLASLAGADDVSGLPPTLVVTAECDPLRDQAESFAARLAREGVQVNLFRTYGMCHGFLSMNRDVPQATRALVLAASMIGVRRT